MADARVQHRDRRAHRAQQPAHPGGAGAGSAPREVVEPLVLMLAPLAPHVAEELWARLGHAESLTYEPFPVADPALLVDDTVEIPVQVNGKVRGRHLGGGRRHAGRARGRGPGRRQGRRAARRARPSARSSSCPAAWSTSSSADPALSRAGFRRYHHHCSPHFLLLLRAPRLVARVRRSTVAEPRRPRRGIAVPVAAHVEPEPLRRPVVTPDATVDGDPSSGIEAADPPRPHAERRLRFVSADGARPVADGAARRSATWAGVVVIVVAVVAGVVWYRMGVGGAAHGERARHVGDGGACERDLHHEPGRLQARPPRPSRWRIVVHVAGQSPSGRGGTRRRCPGHRRGRGGGRRASPDGDLDRLNLAAKFERRPTVLCVVGPAWPIPARARPATRPARAEPAPSSRREAEPQHRDPGPARGAAGRSVPRSRRRSSPSAQRRGGFTVGQRPAQRARHRRQALRRPVARHRLIAGPRLVVLRCAPGRGLGAALLIAVVGGVAAWGRRDGGRPWSTAARRSQRMLACVARSRRVRAARMRSVAFALLAMVVTQRALHGIEVSPLAAAVTDGPRPPCTRDLPTIRRVTASNGRAASTSTRSAGATPAGAGCWCEPRATWRVGCGCSTPGNTVRLRGWFAPLEGFDTRWRWRARGGLPCHRRSTRRSAPRHR